jgi:hypothetical protein
MPSAPLVPVTPVNAAPWTVRDVVAHVLDATSGDCSRTVMVSRGEDGVVIDGDREFGSVVTRALAIMA